MCPVASSPTKAPPASSRTTMATSTTVPTRRGRPRTALTTHPRFVHPARRTGDYRAQRVLLRSQEVTVDFDVLIEIPKGQRNKYEVDHATGRIRLDRMLFTSTRYPADYGFIENTLGMDGDPLDALVLLEEPTFPGCLIKARALGHVPDDRRGRRRRQGAVRAGHRPAVGAPARHPPRAGVRPAGDPALLRGLQGPRARQVGRGRDVGRPGGGRGGDQGVGPAAQGRHPRTEPPRTPQPPR